MSTTRRQRRGMTLVEVLVAIAIVGFAAAGLSAAFANALTALATLREENDLDQDLRHVRRAVLQIADLETLEEGGEITTLRHGLATWEVEVVPTPVLDLFEVTLRIRLEPEEGEPVERVQLLRVLRPTWSDPVDRGQLLEDRKSGLELERSFRPW